MKNKEFLGFLIDQETPPAALKIAIQKDIALSFRKKNILLKFLGYQIVGALFSMSICPQFGLGLVEGHGITHMFRMIGDWACAAFCASVFLSSGMLTAFIGMKGEELWWVWRRYKFSLVFLPTLLWGALMLSNVSLGLPSETPVYHSTWLVMAVLVQVLWLEFRGRTYARVFVKA